MKSVRILVFAFLLASIALLTACNTLKGFGRDVEKGGQTIQSVAEKARPSR